MRSWCGLLLAALCSTGCDDASTGRPADLSVPTDGPTRDQGMICAPGCEPGCQAGFVCINQSIADEFSAFCAPPCDTTADCLKDGGSSGFHCVSVFNHPGVPSVCLPADMPTRCQDNPSFECLMPPDSCKSANVLRHGFIQTASLLCGTEYIHCPNGCEDRNNDGGVAAHCK